MSKNPFRVKGALQAAQLTPPHNAPLAPGVQRPVGEPVTGENLSGQVQGQPASDLEERVARSVAKHATVRQYVFNPRLLWGGVLLPPDVTLSYAIYAPVLYPVQVDPAYPLNTGEERAAAQVNDDLLTEFLKENGGAQPVTRLSRLELATQTMTDRTLGGLL